VAEAGDAEVWENTRDTLANFLKTTLKKEDMKASGNINSDDGSNKNLTNKVWKRFKLGHWNRKFGKPPTLDDFHQTTCGGLTTCKKD